ncbi:MAG: 4-hydroxy-tetrahydrodipicolinate synthase [Opitutae bacterium]|nr:4-hydroxy-tetrahydrodipicolinate synthase [Opitutae bacterium]|tara:strand:- start:908 stop:1789 length:882 start_codon:yes stop_codon:yes gene_type:complete
MDKKLLHGVHTALITPMKDGEVSYGDLENLISKQIDGNVSGLVPCGTTGESPTLCKDEHLEVIRQTIGMVNGKVPVIAGTGANSTQEALFLTENADQAGADAFLIVAPYYNKPSQDGLFAHFSAIAKRTDKPIVLYSIPSRCGIEISTDTVKRLRENHPHICALKEAGGRSSKVSETVVALDSDFTVLSGDDGLTLPFMACGAKGVVSVASNLIPQKVVSLVSLALEGKFIDAQKIHLENYNFFTDIFCEPNPVPIKTLLHLKNVISSAEVRLPLSPVSASNKQLLEKIASDL